MPAVENSFCACIPVVSKVKSTAVKIFLFTKEESQLRSAWGENDGQFSVLA